MTYPDLFERIDYKNDRYSVAKKAINSVADTGLIDALGYWMKGIGYGNDGGGCIFPEEDEDFEGVFCYTCMDEEVTISEEDFFSLLSQAIQRHIEIYPNSREKLKQIISQSTNSYLTT